MRGQVQAMQAVKESSLIRLAQAMELQISCDERAARDEAENEKTQAKRKNEKIAREVAESQSVSEALAVQARAFAVSEKHAEVDRKEAFLAEKKAKAELQDEQMKKRVITIKQAKAESGTLKEAKIQSEPLEAQIARMVKNSPLREADVDAELRNLSDMSILSHPSHAPWSGKEVTHFNGLLPYTDNSSLASSPACWGGIMGCTNGVKMPLKNCKNTV